MASEDIVLLSSYILRCILIQNVFKEKHFLHMIVVSSMLDRQDAIQVRNTMQYEVNNAQYDFRVATKIKYELEACGK